MSYAVKIGTADAVWIDDDPTPSGCVRFDGEITSTMVWGDDIQNLREPNTVELLSAGRANIKQKLSDLAADKIAAIFGKPAKSMNLLIKEVNLSNRCNELRDLLATATLTAEEQAELDILNSYWARVKAIRLYEKQRAIEVETADLATFDVNFGWPE